MSISESTLLGSTQFLDKTHKMKLIFCYLATNGKKSTLKWSKPN